MTTEELLLIVTSLEESQRELNDVASGVSEADARAKPFAERWSVLEIVEHVASVERRSVAWLERPVRVSTSAANAEKAAAVVARVHDRENKIIAPEPVMPRDISKVCSRPSISSTGCGNV